MELHAVEEDFLATDIIEFAVLKAPWGRWRIDEESGIRSHENRYVTDLVESLDSIATELLGDNVTITLGVAR